MAKRYCWETCTREEAAAETDPGVAPLTLYWVRTANGTIDRWLLDSEEIPANCEFVRPVEGA